MKSSNDKKIVSKLIVVLVLSVAILSGLFYLAISGGIESLSINHIDTPASYSTVDPVNTIQPQTPAQTTETENSSTPESAIRTADPIETNETVQDEDNSSSIIEDPVVPETSAK